ncbi:MAG: hypothetical protein IRZ28_15045 [Steroidobacteraceae bacterium]|nr:hypothetical protein [Steroidobacteraceae bacterium]
MDRQRIENEHIVARYLAGALNDADAAAFEDYYLRHPEVVDDIEATLRLREGLAVLQERGELDRLMRAPSRWVLSAAIAAALAVLAFGGWLWANRTTAPPVLASAVWDLTSETGGPPAVASTHILARMRGAGPVELPLPKRGALELRMMPSTRAPEASFRVQLARLGEGNERTDLGQAQALPDPQDGLLTAYVDAARLQAGRYEIELILEASDEDSTATDRFVIDLR